MRKKILILLSLILPAFVYADSCTINKKSIANNNKSIINIKIYLCIYSFYFNY